MSEAFPTAAGKEVLTTQEFLLTSVFILSRLTIDQKRPRRLNTESSDPVCFLVVTGKALWYRGRGAGFSAGQNPKLVNLSGMDIGLGAGKIAWSTKRCILPGNTSIRT